MHNLQKSGKHKNISIKSGLWSKDIMWSGEECVILDRILLTKHKEILYNQNIEHLHN